MLPLSASFISSAWPSPIVEDFAKDQSSTFVGTPGPVSHQSAEAVIFGGTVTSNEGIPRTPPNVRSYQLLAPSIAGTPSSPFYNPRAQDKRFITGLANPQGIGFPSELLNKLIGALDPKTCRPLYSDCDPRSLRHYLGANTSNAFYRELCIIQYLKVYALHNDNSSYAPWTVTLDRHHDIIARGLQSETAQWRIGNSPSKQIETTPTNEKVKRSGRDPHKNLPMACQILEIATPCWMMRVIHQELIQSNMLKWRTFHY